MSPGLGGVFSEPEEGESSKNSDILQLAMMGPFWGHRCAAQCAEELAPSGQQDLATGLVR